MFYSWFKNTVLFFALATISCGTGSQAQNPSPQQENSTTKTAEKPIVVGANRTSVYLPMLKGKRVGVVGNQTTVIFKNTFTPTGELTYSHLVDSLLSLEMNITKVFAPEHGFRGKAAAGEHVADGIDVKTGLPIISLYGNNKKPTPKQLENIEVMIFDIQDVGARFYTYISTLHYVMEACAEQNIPLIIFDRPNPNGHYIDGPILNPEYHSFVGMHPVPIVHGMTMGEYAQMVNGEGWLKNGIMANLTVIRMKNYNKSKHYHLPIKPSPNLPNDKAINLYPSLCLFEGTTVSAGRGTQHQFQIFGSPFLNTEKYSYSFVPVPNAGSKYPKHQGEVCFGKNLTQTERLSRINLRWLVQAYHNTQHPKKFFTPFFTNLAGTSKLQEKIENGWTAQQIRKSWQDDLKTYKEMRRPYLLYQE